MLIVKLRKEENQAFEFSIILALLVLLLFTIFQKGKGMCKVINLMVILTLIFCAVSSSYGLVIGDWEDDMDAWVVWNGTTEFSTTGVTLNDKSLHLTIGSGYNNSIVYPVQDTYNRGAFLSSNIFSIDVTFLTSEWTGPGRLQRHRFKDFKEYFLSGTSSRSISLKKLITDDSLLDLNRSQSKIGYAASWALFYYLVHSRHEKLFDYMYDLSLRIGPDKDVSQSEQRIADFEKYFGSIADLEIAWLHFMSGLKE